MNQFTVIEGQQNRRPDIVVFVNGLPLGVIELKNAADEDATIWSAYPSCRPTRRRSPRCCITTQCWWFATALEARIGSLTANQEWFKVWRTIDGEQRCAREAWSWRC